MERLKVDLNNDHSVGLGDNLCLLSALTNIAPPIDLHVTNDHNTYDRLSQYKRIFRIPDSQLVITPAKENGSFNNVGWPVKLFTDYFKPNFISVNGQTIQTSTKKDNEKRCIAIAGAWEPDPKGLNRWPWSRNRPLEHWGKIFQLVKSWGYEVITVDHSFFSLEDKIELMAKHCKAIISYEGGMAHLAHMLKIPCFLVNWKLPSPDTTLHTFHCEFVHRTNSVYLLRHDDEIFTWDVDRFNSIIQQLRQGHTNNRLVNGECTIKFRGPGITGPLKVVNKQNEILLESTGLFGDNKVSELLNQYYTQS
jgi:hypothetical protein